MAESPEDPLIRGLVEGREDAYAALYDRLGSSLFHVARAVLRSREEAEDAVQDVFLGLVRARSSLSAVRNLRAYLFTALHHALLHRVACRQREKTVWLEGTEEPASAMPAKSESEQAARLEKALQGLPAKLRTLIALKIHAGLTFADIAGVLGISPNTAASRYRYAINNLRAALED